MIAISTTAFGFIRYCWMLECVQGEIQIAIVTKLISKREVQVRRILLRFILIDKSDNSSVQTASFRRTNYKITQKSSQVSKLQSCLNISRHSVSVVRFILVIVD